MSNSSHRFNQLTAIERTCLLGPAGSMLLLPTFFAATFMAIAPLTAAPADPAISSAWISVDPAGASGMLLLAALAILAGLTLLPLLRASAVLARRLASPGRMGAQIQAMLERYDPVDRAQYAGLTATLRRATSQANAAGSGYLSRLAHDRVVAEVVMLWLAGEMHRLQCAQEQASPAGFALNEGVERKRASA